MKLIKLFLFFFFLQNLYAQFDGFTPKLPIQSTEIYKNSNIYQQDFLYLCEGLEKFHANVFLNFPKSEFKKEKEKFLKDLASCKDEKEFGYIANKFTNRIKDGHTNVKIESSIGKNYTYPFRCKYLVDTLVIMAVSDQLPFSLCGEKIKSINNISVKDIEKITSDIYSTENYVSLQRIIMLSINSTEFLKSIGIISADTERIMISTFDGKEFEAQPNFEGEWKSEIWEKHPITEKKSEPFSYKIVNEDSICYIQFNEMKDKRIGEMYLNLQPLWLRWIKKTIRFFGGSAGFSKIYFEDFMNDCIADIKKNKIKKIIVDLRWDAGGSMSLGDILLYALGVDKYKSYSSEINDSELYKLQMKTLDIKNNIAVDSNSYDGIRYTKNTLGTEKIKSRFHGEVYFITSEWTFSAAVQLATIVKDNHLFKVIGEPVSERPSHFGEVLFLKLPNTKAICGISSKLFHRPDRSRDNEETLYPDITIYKTYKSIKDGIDPVYNWIVRN